MKKLWVVFILILTIVFFAGCNEAVTPDAEDGIPVYSLTLFQDYAGYFSVLVPQGVKVVDESTQLEPNNVYYELFDPEKKNKVTLLLTTTKTSQGLLCRDIINATPYNGGFYYISEVYDPDIGHKVNFATFTKYIEPNEMVSLGVVLNEYVNKETFLQMADSLKVLKDL